VRTDRIRAAGAASLRVSRRRITASTLHRGGDAPRTARLRARTAARWPPSHITWRYAQCRAGTALAWRVRGRSCVAASAAPTRHCSLRCAASHNTRYVFPAACASRTGRTCCVARSRACWRTHALRASTRACRHARAGSRIRARVARGSLSGLRHCSRHARGRRGEGRKRNSRNNRKNKIKRAASVSESGARCCRRRLAPCSARQGRGKWLRQP
jgi:hypothetical protein